MDAATITNLNRKSRENLGQKFGLISLRTFKGGALRTEEMMKIDLLTLAI